MKTMIYSLTLAALMITSFSSCSDDNDPVLTQKDWDGTTTYFASADAMKFDTYYKPSVGYVGDPMPFYDPQAKDFKIISGYSIHKAHSALTVKVRQWFVWPSPYQYPPMHVYY